VQIKITDKITLMLTEQGFTYSNWLYINDDVQAVIETGLDGNGLLGLDPQKIDLIINSHHHIDHIRGNALFPRADIMIHELEAPILKDEKLSFYSNSMDLWDELMPGVDIQKSHDEIGLGKNDLANSPFNSSRNVIPLRAGQILDFGTVKAEVLHTPGHSAGHCCFWFPEEEFLFSSDICLTKVGPWYGEHLASPSEMMRSIDRLIDLSPPRVISSHIHEVVCDPVPRLLEFKQRIEKREERVYKYLEQQPSNIHNLADANIIYRAHPTNYVVFWEKLMLLKHIESLEKQSRVAQSDGIYYGI